MPKAGSSQSPNAPTAKPGGKTTANRGAKPRRHGRNRPDAASDKADAKDGRMRIAKAMAQAGLCSRRDAERWIADGRVAVNGSVITSPALDVGPDDKIVVDGAALPTRAPTQLWRYHKPRGQVTTHRDPQGRDTVFDNLPPDLPRVVSIGRLDFNTEGLLLLTNDGELARHLELPSTGWLRRYRVRAHGSITQAQLDTLREGITLEGVRYGPIEATLDSQKGANSWISIGIREGKNREVRKVLSSLGLTVNRLIRVSYGPFQLLDLKPGEADVVKRRVIVEQLGKETAERFNLGAQAALEAEARKQTDRIESQRRTEPRSRPPRARSSRSDEESGTKAREARDSRKPRAKPQDNRSGPSPSSRPQRGRRP